MQLRGIGIDIDDARVNGDLQVLDSELSSFQSFGFDVVELTTSGLFFIFNGNLKLNRARAIERVLQRYPFRYTLHLPDDLSLGRFETAEIDQQIFRSCIDFADLVGAQILVYHSGQDYCEISSPNERNQARDRESAALAEMAAQASRSEIMITVENHDPRPGEIEQLIRSDLTTEELRLIHPGLFPDEITSQIEEINCSNLWMTLDFGHLYLSVELTGQDLLSTIERQAGFIRHIHLSDNFGKNNLKGESQTNSRMEQVLRGDGDCHLPPGLGTLPIRDCLRCLPEYAGYLVFEVRPEFRDYLPESLTKIKELISLL
jgi:sugar phosphate isomerase/epimerase